MPTIPDFIRCTPPASLRDYFTATFSALPPDVPWDGKPSDVVQPLLRAVDEMDDTERMRVMNDADRVGAMADEAGQTALFAVTTSPDILEDLENGYARSLWMFLNDLRGFDRAEEVRYADDRRYGRMWEAFLCDSNLVVPRDGAPVTAFERAVAQHFDSRNVLVEICDRSRPNLEGDDTGSPKCASPSGSMPSRVFVVAVRFRSPSPCRRVAT